MTGKKHIPEHLRKYLSDNSAPANVSPFSSERRLCMIGCGNLGTPILSTLLSSTPTSPLVQFTHYTACIASVSSEKRLRTLFASHISSQKLRIARATSDVALAVSTAHVVILAVDPSQVERLLSNSDIRTAFHRSPYSTASSNDEEKQEKQGKLLISVVAGLSVARLNTILSPASHLAPRILYILRALPNVCAQVSQSLTAIERPSSSLFPEEHLSTAKFLFQQIGQIELVPAALMPAATAVGGSTPAFWAIIVDALVDAAVSTGMPREMAQKMIYTSMRGSAEMLLEGGLQPGGLRDIGTSPAGCTIAGIMVLEEMGVRAAVGKALRESVGRAKEMGKEEGGKQ